MQTVSIHDELAALRMENARLKSDIALMNHGSLDLLYRIRNAAGLNQYCELSGLDDYVRQMRKSLQDMLELFDDGSARGNPKKQFRLAHARIIARGTGDVPQAAE